MRVGFCWGLGQLMLSWVGFGVRTVKVVMDCKDGTVHCFIFLCLSYLE